MNTILFMATYGDFLATFELENILRWKKLGCKVIAAADYSNPAYNRKINRFDEYGIERCQVRFSRNPKEISNLKGFVDLLGVMNKYKIDVLDTHNAIPSVYARIAAYISRVKYVIYTPHSFFFYKGCPLENRIIYKNIERVLAGITDTIIAINNEDYSAAKKFNTRDQALYVPGVGIDIRKFSKSDLPLNDVRNRFSVPKSATLFISVGELIPRKNHIFVLEALKEVKNKYKDKFRYIVCGIGSLQNELVEYVIQNNLSEEVQFLGYRDDVKELLYASDFFVFPSRQEGLPVALMEAMACGLPCVVSKIRGNVDLIEDQVGGRIFSLQKGEELVEIIHQCCNQDLNDRLVAGRYNRRVIQTRYSKDIVNAIMNSLYSSVLMKIS